MRRYSGNAEQLVQRAATLIEPWCAGTRNSCLRIAIHEPEREMKTGNVRIYPGKDDEGSI